MEEENYEIDDFTTAGEDERFIVRVEECLNKFLKLLPEKFVPFRKVDRMQAVYSSKTIEIVDIIGYEYQFQLFYSQSNDDPDATEQQCSKSRKPKSDESTKSILTDIDNASLDFYYTPIGSNPNNHVIQDLYSLQNFIIAKPLQDSSCIKTESDLKLLESLLIIASSNANCFVPIFISVLEPWRQMYFGFMTNSHAYPPYRTHFHQIHSKKTPLDCDNLQGLLKMFKEEVYPQNVHRNPVDLPQKAKISLKFSYSFNLAFLDKLIGIDQIFNDSINRKSSKLWENIKHDEGVANKIPWGVAENPVDNFILSAAWNGLSEDVVVERQLFSDIDPSNAPRWMTHLLFKQHCKTCAYTILDDFADYLDREVPVKEYSQFCPKNLPILNTNSSTSSTQNRQHIEPGKSEKNLNEALSNITSSRFEKGLNKVTNQMSKMTNNLSAVSLENVEDVQSGIDPTMMLDAAPPAHLINEMISYIFKHHEGQKNELKVDDFLMKMKLVPQNSICSRLATCIFVLLGMDYRVCGIAVLWLQFVRKLENFYDQTNCLLPGIHVNESSPDHAYSLLHQKLQMFQLCLQRKLSSSASNPEQCSVTIGNQSSDDEDEFFDAIDQDEASKPQEVQLEAEGRKESLQDMYYVQDKTKQIFVPVTQDPPILTEDMMLEALETFDNDNENSTKSQMQHTRHTVHYQALKSDMSAFKAANPNSILEDFVRWYSPRDYIDEEERLSERMLIPNNIWQKYWQQAPALSVKKQKRLFDETVESRGIIKYFCRLSVSELCNLLLPSMLAVTVENIFQGYEEIKQLGLLNVEKPKFQPNLNPIERLAPSLAILKSVPVNSLPNEDILQRIINDIHQVELEVSRTLLLHDSFATIRAKTKLYAYESDSVRKLLDKVHSTKDEALDLDSDEFLCYFVQMVNGEEYELLGGSQAPLGSIVKEYISYSCIFDLLNAGVELTGSPSQIKVWSNIYQREYYIRMKCSRPSQFNAALPQVLYCSNKKDELRISTALSDHLVPAVAASQYE